VRIGRSPRGSKPTRAFAAGQVGLPGSSTSTSNNDLPKASRRAVGNSASEAGKTRSRKPYAHVPESSDASRFSAKDRTADHCSSTLYVNLVWSRPIHPRPRATSDVDASWLPVHAVSLLRSKATTGGIAPTSGLLTETVSSTALVAVARCSRAP
jgi:hypothetical protein